MSKQLMIYERAVAISSDRHRDWSLVTGGDYKFARGVNSVPLLAAEFVATAVTDAIVFAGSETDVVPTVILGMRDGENASVATDGRWIGGYIPAFLRRYPFVFAKSDDGKTFTLCIDEVFEGFNQDGRGERLFDVDGKRTRYLESMLAFVDAPATGEPPSPRKPKSATAKGRPMMDRDKGTSVARTIHVARLAVLMNSPIWLTARTMRVFNRNSLPPCSEHLLADSRGRANDPAYRGFRAPARARRRRPSKVARKSTGSGQVTVSLDAAKLAGGEVEAASGDVRISLGSVPALTLSVSTTSGDIDAENLPGTRVTRRTERRLEDDVHGGGASLRIHTASGSS